jgi:hypothetical protein
MTPSPDKRADRPTGRLVLHLGDHKTGSTSIQSAFASGGVTARGVRLCYPRGTPVRANHNHAVRSLIRARRGTEDDGEFARLAEEIRRTAADVTVLSAEALERTDPALVDRALRHYLPDYRDGVQLVVYLRPHAERLVSTYAEQVKQGLFHGTLEAFHAASLADRRFFYAPRLDRWRALFGTALTVRPLVRARLKDGDVVADFLACALPGVAVDIDQQPPRNTKATLADLAVLLALQDAVAHLRGSKGLNGDEPFRTLGWRVALMLEADRVPGPAPALHRTLADELAETYAEDAAAVDASYFGGEAILAPALAAAPAQAVPEPQSLRLEDHFAPQTVAAIRAWIGLVADLYAHRPADWPAHFKAHPLRTGKD